MKRAFKAVSILAAVCVGGTVHAALDLKIQRGLKTSTFADKPADGEVCIIPKNFPTLEDQADIDKDQEDLCKIDFYKPVPKKKKEGEFNTFVTCAKDNSTNPGIDVYELDDDAVKAGQITREIFDKQQCPRHEGERTEMRVGGKKVKVAKKAAKLKQSITCSYTPSILVYYQLSQALGDILQIPASVVRTMNKTEHDQIIDEGLRTRISGSWKQVDNASENTAGHTELYTVGGKYMFGALVENVRGESFNSAFYNGAAGYSDAPAAFARSPIWALVKASGPIKIDRKFTAKSAQQMQWARDASDMVILDTILNQADRWGNEHQDIVYQWIENGKVEQISAKKLEKKTEEEQENIKAKAVQVQRLVLKDNDCGVNKENKTDTRVNGLRDIRHMHPETYKNLGKIAKHNREEISNYLKTEMLFEDKELKSVLGNLDRVWKTVHDRCVKGELLLDLDMNEHLSPSPVTHSCD